MTPVALTPDAASAKLFWRRPATGLGNERHYRFDRCDLMTCAVARPSAIVFLQLPADTGPRMTTRTFLNARFR